MPGAMEYKPDDRELRDAAKKERETRLKLSERNWKYYLGNHKKWLLDDKDNVVINLCKQTVDRTISFLAPEMPRVELSGEKDQADEETERELVTVWRQNGGAVLLWELALYGALNGHIFARVVDREGQLPKIVALNPANVIVFWDADDKETVLWYEVQWKMGKYKYRQDIVNDGTRWRIMQYVMKASRWEFEEDTFWNFPLGPIVDWQHLSDPQGYYGNDELPHAPLNDSINKVVSDMARIIRFHAYPKTVGTGFEANELQAAGIDDFWTVPNENAKVFNLEMQSDLQASMALYKALAASFFAESRVVQLPADLDAFKGVTNLGIRTIHMDMLMKNEMLRRQYGNGILDISQLIRMLMGRDPEPRGEVVWADPLPVDDKEVIMNLQSVVNMGLMSKQTAAQRLPKPVDFEKEAERITDEYMNPSSGFVPGMDLIR